MTPNIPLLRKVVEWVEEQQTHPHEERVWDQSIWCGTTHCVAGKVALLEGWVHVGTDLIVVKDGIEAHVTVVAREALGLSTQQSGIFFLGGNDAEGIRLLAEQFAGERL